MEEITVIDVKETMEGLVEVGQALISGLKLSNYESYQDNREDLQAIEAALQEIMIFTETLQ